MSINKVILIGAVGKDPKINSTQNGDKVANFSIATSESWKDKAGEKQERVEWHNVVVWGGLAGIVEKYVKKGTKIYVQGKLQTRKWTDKEGIEKYTTEIVLQGYGAELELLSKSEAQIETTAQEYAQATSGTHDAVEGLDDEIPF